MKIIFGWIAILAWLFTALNVAGCGQPQYQLIPTKAENKVRFYKGSTGMEAEATIGADSEGTIGDVEAGDGTRHFKLGQATFKAKPSETYTASVGPMMAYREQQTGYKEIRATEWAGLNTFWSNTLSAAAPIIGMAVQGHYSTAQLKAQQPSIKRELVNLIGGGLISAFQGQQIADELPFDTSDIWNNPIVKARLEQMAAEIAALKNPTTQPGA